MLTYSFADRGTDTLYEYLYKQIKKDIISMKLVPDEQLPSKRALAKHLNISTITVENAYSQLVAEGYIYAKPRSGFYVSPIQEEISRKKKRLEADSSEAAYGKSYYADFVNNSISTEKFPFSVWTRLMRETMSDMAEQLMAKSPSQGVLSLRKAISDYLYQFRGMVVSPDRIIIGAGTEYLYGLIIQLLGRNMKYAVEDPGYQKISHIYQANDVNCLHIPIDDFGIDIAALEAEGADVLHISPSHHFPTGLVTPVSRRYELLSWASKSPERYIIEDDYDSEFRLLGKPIPSLQSIDVLDKVIYINTFSKSLTSTIRISYMVLPEILMERYNRELSFYACTVSNFEQYTLAGFINQGFLEKHINRMRNYYRGLRDDILKAVRSMDKYNCVHIREENAGLHFLMEVDTDLEDEEIVELAAENGIHISTLSEYYYNKNSRSSHIVVINYSGTKPDQVNEAVHRLFKSMWR
jgi:GntR family transcriptional regulator/MocR family aminotransferase